MHDYNKVELVKLKQHVCVCVCVCVCVYTVVASSIAVSDPLQAKRLGRAAVGLSVTGIIITLIVILIFVILPFAFGISELDITDAAK